MTSTAGVKALHQGREGGRSAVLPRVPRHRSCVFALCERCVSHLAALINLGDASCLCGCSVWAKRSLL